MITLSKIKQKVKKVEEKKELNLGNKGDLILLRAKGRTTYTIGRLEGMTTLTIRSGMIKFDAIEFAGNSYTFSSEDYFGVKVPTLKIRNVRTGSFHDSKYFDARLVEECISGTENVLRYLEARPEYRAHADLLRTILKAQRK